jgi:hypothetical protein
MEFGTKDELKQIMTAYEKINNELNNYKELYFKEKEKSNLYKEQYESLRKNPEESERLNNTNLNSNTNDDRVFVDEIISQIQNNEDSNHNIQNNPTNSTYFNKWKDETSKLSQNYKEDLSSLKMAYKQKILMLHNSMFSKNNSDIINDDISNVNYINNNTEKLSIKSKENNIMDTPFNTGEPEIKNNIILHSYIKNKIENEKNKSIKKDANNSLDSRKLINNESEALTVEEMLEDDDVIIQINNGQIFNKIQLNYEVSNDDNVNNIGNIKNIYSQKIDELEKSMENLKRYIETYYRKKIQKMNENVDFDSAGLIEGELPVTRFTTQHQNTLKKLRELYENKVKEIESSFFNILKIITAKRMSDMNQ